MGATSQIGLDLADKRPEGTSELDRPADGIASNLDRLANGPRTGQILTLPVEVPGAGRP